MTAITRLSILALYHLTWWTNENSILLNIINWRSIRNWENYPVVFKMVCYLNCLNLMGKIQLILYSWIIHSNNLYSMLFDINNLESHLKLSYSRETIICFIRSTTFIFLFLNWSRNIGNSWISPMSFTLYFTFPI